MIKGKKFQRIEISDEIYNQVKKIEETISSAKLYKRAQALKLLHKKWKYSAIAEFLNIGNGTMTDWMNLYKKEGLLGFLTLKYKGGQAKLSKKQLDELKEQAGKGNFTFAKDIQHYIKVHFKIKYGLRHVQLLAKKNFAYPLSKLD